MGTSPALKAGSVVLVRFPFSDLSATKLRPAVDLADVGRGDYILAQITSRSYGDDIAVELTDESFEQGGLERASYARPGKLFTANEVLIDHAVGDLTAVALDRLVSTIIGLFRQEP